MIEAAFAQSDHAINLTDTKGVLLRVNDAYLHLYKFDSEIEVLGKTQRIIRGSQTPDAIYKGMWETISVGRTWTGDLTNQAKDGSDVFIHLTITPIQENGSIVGFMGLSLDRAQQMILERQLFHASKLAILGTLGAGLAHELNNPLAAVLLDAEFIQETLNTPSIPVPHQAQALNAAESLIRGVERIRRVLKHFLVYSKQEAPQSTSSFVLKEALNDTLLLIERQLLGKGIEVVVNAESEIWVQGNRTQFESVLHNLLSNSRDAFAGRPQVVDKKIFISAQTIASDSRILLEYRDNAGGIPDELIPRIFEPFFTIKGGDNSGLGLALSRKILRDHGGDIECESGNGETCFRVWIPAVSVAPSSKTPNMRPQNRENEESPRIRIQRSPPPRISRKDLGISTSREQKEKDGIDNKAS